MKRLCIFGALMSSLAPLANADVLAEYLFSNGAKGSSDTEIRTTATTFGFGPVSTSWGFSSVQDNVYGRATTTQATQADAAEGDSYFTFTLNVGALGAGNGLNLTSLTFDSIANAASGVTGDATANFFVRSSLDDFAANIGPVFTQTYVNNATPISPISREVDLSAYQGVVASSIVFRIYVFDDSADINRTPRLDSVVLNGSVSAIAIPEPAAAASWAAGGVLIGVLGFRRRRVV